MSVQVYKLESCPPELLLHKQSKISKLSKKIRSTLYEVLWGKYKTSAFYIIYFDTMKHHSDTSDHFRSSILSTICSYSGPGPDPVRTWTGPADRSSSGPKGSGPRSTLQRKTIPRSGPRSSKICLDRTWTGPWQLF